MTEIYSFSKEVAATALHANDYAQLETLANRAAFERSLVEDLISEDAYWNTAKAACPKGIIQFNAEDVRQRLSRHEQQMLENFMRLVYDAYKQGILT